MERVRGTRRPRRRLLGIAHQRRRPNGQCPVVIWRGNAIPWVRRPIRWMRPMALEKKQVFPDLFRYVCDSCSFDWPRTPVKENDLPPPPSHSCPNTNRPEPKPVIEEQEKKTAKDPKPKPVAVCTRCGAVSYATNMINGQCAQTVAGKRCVGVNGSALNADDWKQCETCAGTGSRGKMPCGHCDGAGWLYAQNKGRS